MLEENRENYKRLNNLGILYYLENKYIKIHSRKKNFVNSGSNNTNSKFMIDNSKIVVNRKPIDFKEIDFINKNLHPLEAHYEIIRPSNKQNDGMQQHLKNFNKRLILTGDSLVQNQTFLKIQRHENKQNLFLFKDKVRKNFSNVVRFNNKLNIEQHYIDFNNKQSDNDFIANNKEVSNNIQLELLVNNRKEYVSHSLLTNRKIEKNVNSKFLNVTESLDNNLRNLVGNNRKYYNQKKEINYKELISTSSVKDTTFLKNNFSLSKERNNKERIQIISQFLSNTKKKEEKLHRKGIEKKLNQEYEDYINLDQSLKSSIDKITDKVRKVEFNTFLEIQ